jgi:hypothetical protein
MKQTILMSHFQAFGEPQSSAPPESVDSSFSFLILEPRPTLSASFNGVLLSISHLVTDGDGGRSERTILATGPIGFGHNQ